MVQKKRKSKRLTSRQQHKLQKRTKRTILDQKKLQKKLEAKPKVPAYILRTPEEQQTYEAIKKGVQLRQQTYDKERTTKVYFKYVNTVIEKSDVILQILDARDIQGSRNMEVEKKIHTADKKLVMIVNKTDLVPKTIVNSWIETLKKEYPTFTNNKDEIFNLLKNYTRTENGERKITVGVIGYPNVGKSTFINGMVHNKSCNTGSKAGITKDVQLVSLEKNINFLDCPGILENSEINLGNVLRNAINLENIDVIKFVEEALRYFNFEELALFYELEKFENSEDFMKLLGKKYGLILKKGIININESAKRFLRDIYNNRIVYYHILEENEDEIIGNKISSKLQFNYRVDA